MGRQEMSLKVDAAVRSVKLASGFTVGDYADALKTHNRVLEIRVDASDLLPDIETRGFYKACRVLTVYKIVYRGPDARSKTACK